MQFLILKNNKPDNYSATIQILLEEIAQSKSYNIQHIDGLKKIATPVDDSMTFITLGQASLINKLLQPSQLSAFIKKHTINLLIQNAGFFIKQKKVAQLIIVNDIEQLPPVKKLSYSKIFLLTYSQFAKQVITDKGFTNIVHVVPFFAEPKFQPINWSMKQQVKIDYTESREYFIVQDNFTSIEKLLQLLKAFTVFKKWQQSGMKLVLTGNLYVPLDDWQEKLSTYKYRDDVLVYNKRSEEEKRRLLAGAYACVQITEKDNNLLPLLQAMCCHTPVIAFETASIKEYATGAIIGVEAGNYEELGQQMIMMYKDETMRNTLIENIALRADEYSKENVLRALENIVL